MDQLYVLDVRQRNNQINTSTPWVFTTRRELEITIPASCVDNVLTGRIREMPTAPVASTNNAVIFDTGASATPKHCIEHERRSCQAKCAAELARRLPDAEVLSRPAA